MYQQLNYMGYPYLNVRYAQSTTMTIGCDNHTQHLKTIQYIYNNNNINWLYTYGNYMCCPSESMFEDFALFLLFSCSPSFCSCFFYFFPRVLYLAEMSISCSLSFLKISCRKKFELVLWVQYVCLGQCYWFLFVIIFHHLCLHAVAEIILAQQTESNLTNIRIITQFVFLYHNVYLFDQSSFSLLSVISCLLLCSLLLFFCFSIVYVNFMSHCH